MWPLLLGALAWGEPSTQALIHANARLALREEKPLETAKLWLLRNSVEAETGVVSAADGDLHTATWAALGELGLCPDGLARDTDGAGLWPISLHNYVVISRRRAGAQAVGAPWRAFEVERQQRAVNWQSVLSVEELRTVHFERRGCLYPRVELAFAGENPLASLRDKAVTARLLYHLLGRALETLDEDLVRGSSVLEMRRFDLHLQIAELAEREARRRALEAGRQGREGGLAAASLRAMREDAVRSTLSVEDETRRILSRAEQWPASEWMALSAQRRRFLYERLLVIQGRPLSEETSLEILDVLMAEGDGAEVSRWIGTIGPRVPHEAIWGGARGARLLALEPESGFRERGVIALFRGVQALEGGALTPALRDLAFALREAPQSAEAEALGGLALRWVSHVAGQFQITEELLYTLQEMVPPREFNILLEDLLWKAALRADAPSFDRGLAAQRGQKLALLKPLAHGDPAKFLAGWRRTLREEPGAALRLAARLVGRIELEEAEVRERQLATLRAIQAPLDALSEEEGAVGRRAEAVGDDIAAILEGAGASGEGLMARVRAVDPDAAVFAGSVRLAPVDPLPWPFQAEQALSPPVFTPIRIRPVEWRDASGALRYGWSLSE